MKNKKTPMRRCVACKESKPKQELIRIAFYEGELTVDPNGRAKGRGLYLCKDINCIETAIKKKAIQRGFKAEIDQDQIDRVYEELKNYAE
ncbi:MAG: YlxR family protein [Bacillota bacterium]|nr:YlxR family protein [Bacillota bacterium]